jgi:alpha-beta hydrolase superfamily lysophospholipase
MKTENVNFVNRSGYQISGLLDVPSEGPARVYALFAHCFTCGKDLKPFANLNAALTERGIGVLRFDFAGLGKSGGEFSDSNLSSNESDLIDAARFMETNFAAPRILIGHSMGGAAVLLAAPHIASVTAVVTIGAPADAMHLGEKLNRARTEAQRDGEARVAIGGQTFTLTREFFDDLERTSLDTVIGALDKALLVLHSPHDESVGIENAAAIFRAAQHPKSFVALNETDHLMLNERDARYAGAVIAAWAERYLS